MEFLPIFNRSFLSPATHGIFMIPNAERDQLQNAEDDARDNGRIYAPWFRRFDKNSKTLGVVEPCVFLEDR